jgi:hypothetical protein
MIVATKRLGFAVLAADRFHGATQPRAPKVVWHPNPSIPLAFAIGGHSHLLLNGRPAPATEHLLEFARRITSPNDLELRVIDRRLMELLSPGIEEKQGEARVYIALVRNGRADLGFRNFSFQAGRLTSAFFEECRHFCPSQLETAFQPSDWESFHDERVADGRVVIDQARRLVEQGISFDRALHNGVPGSCDGPAEVVLVSAAGARPA